MYSPCLKAFLTKEAKKIYSKTNSPFVQCVTNTELLKNTLSSYRSIVKVISRTDRRYRWAIHCSSMENGRRKCHILTSPPSVSMFAFTVMQCHGPNVRMWISMGLMEYIVTACCCNFSNFKYSMCRICIHFVCTSNCFRVHSSYHLEPLFTEHVISMATA